MKQFNQLHIRNLHFKLAPIVVLPLFITLITGSLFQIAFFMGQGDNYWWLLDMHRGKFGNLDLEWIYPFLNAFGLLMMIVSGLILWWSRFFKNRKTSKS